MSRLRGAGLEGREAIRDRQRLRVLAGRTRERVGDGGVFRDGVRGRLERVLLQTRLVGFAVRSLGRRTHSVEGGVELIVARAQPCIRTRIVGTLNLAVATFAGAGEIARGLSERRLGVTQAVERFLVRGLALLEPRLGLALVVLRLVQIGLGRLDDADEIGQGTLEFGALGGTDRQRVDLMLEVFGGRKTLRVGRELVVEVFRIDIELTAQADQLRADLVEEVFADTEVRLARTLRVPGDQQTQKRVAGGLGLRDAIVTQEIQHRICPRCLGFDVAVVCTCLVRTGIPSTLRDSGLLGTFEQRGNGFQRRLRWLNRARDDVFVCLLIASVCRCRQTVDVGIVLADVVEATECRESSTGLSEICLERCLKLRRIARAEAGLCGEDQRFDLVVFLVVGNGDQAIETAATNATCLRLHSLHVALVRTCADEEDDENADADDGNNANHHTTEPRTV